jgi:hypothetical protein
MPKSGDFVIRMTSLTVIYKRKSSMYHVLMPISLTYRKSIYSDRSKINTVDDLYNDVYTVHGRSVVSMDVWFKIDVPCPAQR